MPEDESKLADTFWKVVSLKYSSWLKSTLWKMLMMGLSLNCVEMVFSNMSFSILISSISNNPLYEQMLDKSST